MSDSKNFTKAVSIKNSTVFLTLLLTLAGCARDLVFVGAGGVVTDAETQAPLEKAVVSAGRADRPLATTRTKSDGTFSIHPVRHLHFSLFGDTWASKEIVISKKGYETTNVYMGTLPHRNEEVEVQLRPQHSPVR